MKKTLLSISMVMMGVVFTWGQLLTDFENNQTVTFSGWPNVPTVVANPYSGGINTSSHCGEWVRGFEQWAHTFADLSTPLDFSTNSTFHLKVYSPITCTVLLKLEVQGGSDFTEVSQQVDTANIWKQLSFDFAGAQSNLYDKIVIFFDFSTGGNDTFHFDDLVLGTGGSGPTLDQISLPIDWEGSTTNYSVTDFGGAVSVLDADPVSASNTVMKTTKDAIAETWAGTTMCTPAGFASAIPFTASDTKISVKVYSPAVGLPVLLKVEDHNDAAVFCETSVNTTVASSWETLEFDFASPTSTSPALNLASVYDLASIFFNFGNNGVTQEFYWDDIQFVGGGTLLDQIDLPIDFEGTTTNFTITDFGGNASVLGADPMLASNTVAITTKTAGAETWAGTTMSTPMGFANAIPFTSTNTKMTVKVYAPAIGVPVRLKVEDHNDDTHSCETEVLTTVANAWETLEFDFTNEATGTAALDLSYTFDMASIFFDFGNTGADDVFYWDDVEFDASQSIENAGLNNLHVFPVPTSDVLFIEGAGDANLLEIYNVLGQNVITQELKSSNNSVSVSALENGIYILNISKNGEKIVSHRIVKQ